MAHYAIQDGYHELLDSTPDTGPEVEVLEKDDGDVLVSIQQQIPEAGLNPGDESWYPQEDIVIVDGSRVVTTFAEKELDGF